MKSVKVNMDMVNTALLVVILGLVVWCCVKQNERFQNSLNVRENRVHVNTNSSQLNANSKKAGGVNNSYNPGMYDDAGPEGNAPKSPNYLA